MGTMLPCTQLLNLVRMENPILHAHDIDIAVRAPKRHGFNTNLLYRVVIAQMGCGRLQHASLKT